MAQRVREEVEARDRDHGDTQRLREDLGGRHSDAQPREHTRPDADRDRRQVVDGRPRPARQTYSIVGASTSACRGDVAPTASPSSTRATQAVLRREHHADPARRGVDPEQQHQITGSGSADACGTSDGPTSRARQRAPSNSNVSTRASSASAGLDADDDAVGRKHLPDRVAPLDERDAGPSTAPRSRGRAAPGSGRGGTRRRARPADGPSYCCTNVNVGLVTGPSTPSPRAIPCANVVLPAPRSPTSTTTSPASRCAASAAATARVVVGRRGVAGSRLAARASRARSRRGPRPGVARRRAAPPTDAASGASVASTPARVNGNCCPRSFVMPSFVSSSSFVAKLPSVTMTRGRISTSWRSSHGAHASISSGSGSRLPGRPALHDVRDVHVGALQADALDQLRQQLARRARRTARPADLPAGPGLHRRTSGRRRRARRRTRPAYAPPRACTTCSRARAPRPRRGWPRGALAGCEEALSDTGDATRGRPPHESTPATTSAVGGPEAVEVHVDRSGRAARPRGHRRSGCATGAGSRAIPSCALCATRWQPSLSQRPSVTTTTSVVFAVSSNGRGSGKPGVPAGAVDPASTRAVVADDVTDRVDDGDRGDGRVVDPRVRDSEAAGHRVVATVPLADRRARLRHRAARLRARRRARS